MKKKEEETNVYHHQKRIDFRPKNVPHRNFLTQFLKLSYLKLKLICYIWNDREVGKLADVGSWEVATILFVNMSNHGANLITMRDSDDYFICLYHLPKSPKINSLFYSNGGVHCFVVLMKNVKDENKCCRKLKIYWVANKRIGLSESKCLTIKFIKRMCISHVNLLLFIGGI